MEFIRKIYASILFWISRISGDLLGFLWFDLLRLRRDVILENLNIVFPDKSLNEKIKIGRRSCFQLGRSISEFIIWSYGNSRFAEDYFELRGREYLDQALQKNKGALLLSLHLGNGDMTIAALAKWGFPIHHISKTFKQSWLNHFWFEKRRKMGVQFIPWNKSSYEILKALKQNGVVIFVLDQFMGPPIGVRTTFFGKETGTPAGLAVFAERSKAPVVPAGSWRKPNGHYVVEFFPPVPFEEKENRDKTIQHMTQIYAHQIEKMIIEHPEDWMWVHRRWKEFRA